jgi:biotin carboxyl carrier protein
MKMETVIRSPQNGVVAKLVHKAGVSGPKYERVEHC